MKILDFSHPITNEMTVFNDSERPVITKSASISTHGYAQSHIDMYSHNGTHIDAPAHILAGRPHLDDFPPEKFTGRAVVIDCSGEGEKIGISVFEERSADLARAEFVLLHTGWDRYWGRKEYLGSFPVLTESAAKYLSELNLKGIGNDAISFDPYDSTALPVHTILLGKDLILIENLTGLKKAGEKLFTFSCFPLPLQEADGSPVRAVGYLE